MHYKAIVLDFDGTICRLFCNYNLNATKVELINLLSAYSVDFNMQNDAFDVFELIYNSDLGSIDKKNLLEKANEIIKHAEIDALSTGAEIAGFSDYLKWIEQNGFSLAIATNNSEECVKEFLNRYYKITDCIVVGRNCQRPDLLKPHPYMLERMCELLNLSKKEICFIGDSIRDYSCAQKFGCDFIGLTPTQKKKEKLQALNGNFMIIDNYSELISKGLV